MRNNKIPVRAMISSQMIIASLSCIELPADKIGILPHFSEVSISKIRSNGHTNYFANSKYTRESKDTLSTIFLPFLDLNPEIRLSTIIGRSQKRVFTKALFGKLTR